MNTGRAFYSMRFEDYAGFVSFLTALGTDAAWQEHWQKMLEAGDTVSVGQTIATEAVGLEASPFPAGGGPRCRVVRGFEIERGRTAEAASLLAQMKPIAEATGGHFSAVTLMFAGPASSQCGYALEFADPAAFAAHMDGLPGNAALQEFAANRLAAAGSPLIQVGASAQIELAI